MEKFNKTIGHTVFYNNILNVIPVILAFLLVWLNVVDVLSVVLLFASLQLLITNISSVVSKFITIKRDYHIIKIAFEFLEADYPISNYFLYQPTPSNELILQNVSFSFPINNKVVLKDINLCIPKGTKVCIVGRNGAGKSSLINLLLNIFIPNEGAINYGSDSRIPLASALFQEYIKLDSTVRENVAIGHIGKSTDDLIKKALYDAKADFVFEAQIGLDGNLGREFGGRTLSGGEWQRIGLARIFLRNEGVIILDEPTSSIDPVAESTIFNSVLERYKENTTIFVSHRLSAAIHADLIVVLDEGRIIEAGTHHELYTNTKIYYEMFNAQAKPYLEFS
ncbi:putative multidrug export ATP-binding/permease protein [compost metagenome]